MKNTRKQGLAFAAALTAAVAGLSSSLAADLPAHKSPHAPVVEAPLTHDWTGFHLGGFAGGSFANSSQGYSVSSTFLTANLPTLIPFVNGAGSQGLKLSGFDLGVEAGYDWKVANNFYLGVAGDLGWTNLGGSRTTSGIFPLVGLPFIINQKLSADWRGSLRLRAGMTPLDNLLVYVTGGAAAGHFTYASSFWDNLVPPFAPGNETENFSRSTLRVGWTLGTGAEWALSRNWSLTGEYRFSEYAAVTGTGILPLQQPPSTAYLGHSSGAIRENTLHIGIDYHYD